MKMRIIKLLILLVVFIGSNIFFAKLMNSRSTESASDLSDPTLPVVYVTVEGQNVNTMHGYTKSMDGRKMRECIIPLTTNREITFSYKAFGNNVESVSYEVTTPDTGERVENAKIGNFKDNGDSRTASFTLSQPLLMDREYPICFTIRCGGKDIYYYARVLQRADLVITQYIEFVNSDAIKFSYNTKNEVTNTSEGQNHSDANNEHIDVPIDNSDNTPSTKDSDKTDSDYSNHSVTTSQLDDGDIRKVNMLLTNYQSIEDVMISVFDQNFIIFEYYTF